MDRLIELAEAADRQEIARLLSDWRRAKAAVLCFVSFGLIRARAATTQEEGETK